MSFLRKLIIMKNRISVITVVKNDKNNIQKTINSVLNQKKCNFEYIIFDGNSKDGTSKKINKYKKKIKIFRQNDLNLYDGINKAIKLSSGNYIFLIHSGDIFKKNNVLKNISRNLNTKPDFISGNIMYYKIVNNRKLINRVWRHPIKKINKFSVLKIPHTSLVIKKKLIEKLNYYDTQYDISSDTDFLIRLSHINSLKHIYVDNFFLYMKNEGLSTKKKNFIRKVTQDFKILFKNYNLFFFVYYIYKIHFKILDFFKNKYK
ncbi:MAG: hypothetical protein CBE33_03940 [Candidatus Pelagibacter sp. TMED273]|nr:MAG: hypothetical protein CBE33_03940 [Candidatus Pelagibacter sp. TMED273]|tara:strand:- start:199 stop:981 length:783 start_codon:yes stop_codon:yes gene_type:complete